MNRSVIAYLNEGRDDHINWSGAGKVTGLVSGLGGALTGGFAPGMYQSHKLQQAEREKARRKGKLDFVKTDKTGRHIGYGVLGSIPLVGAASNAIIAKKRYDLEDELEKDDQEKAKKGKK